MLLGDIGRFPGDEQLRENSVAISRLFVEDKGLCYDSVRIKFSWGAQDCSEPSARDTIGHMKMSSVYKLAVGWFYVQ